MRQPPQATRRLHLAVVFISLMPALSLAATSLVYDSEPNNAPHQAIDMRLPQDDDLLRIIGELEGQDQDAYRLVVADDQGGRRFNLRLTGRAGALTQVDVFDFSAIADDRGRIPETLEQRPINRFTLKARDGSRGAQMDNLVFSPGVYVLGVSHSGGEGAYSLELVQSDRSAVNRIGDDNSKDRPQRLSANGRQVVWTQGETWFEVDLDANEAQYPYTLTFQSELGVDATAELTGADGGVLLELSSEGKGLSQRHGLELPEGIYRIRTQQEQAGVQWVSLLRGAPVAEDGVEREPNDNHPMTVTLGESIRGRFDGNDTDHLRFHVSDEQAALRWNLTVTGGAESNVEVCLSRFSLNRLQSCRRGPGGVTELPILGLVEGDYELRLSDRGPDGADWELSWSEAGPVRPGEETEPNDEPRNAIPLHDRGFGRGQFNRDRDTDYWRFNATGEPQLWRVQLQGEDLYELYLKKEDGSTIVGERGSGQNRIRLENQYLLPGQYLISASGSSGDYTLRLQPLGPPPPGMELEPNDAVGDARQMRFGQTYTGLLAEDGDMDRYRFTLLGDEQVRVHLSPPPDGEVDMSLQYGDEAETIVEFKRQGETGVATDYSAFLPPGDYFIALEAHQVSDAEYSLTLHREDVLAAVTDREPNNWSDGASAFPADGILAGSVGLSRASRDWYRLPVMQTATELTLPELDGIGYELLNQQTGEEPDLRHDREADVYRYDLAANTRYALELRGAGDYRVDLSELLPEPVTASPLPTMELTLPQTPVQAFSPWAQRLEGELVLSNPHDEDISVELRSKLTDLRWRLDGLPQALSLSAGDSRRLPFSVQVAADAVERPDVQLSVHARVGHQSIGETVEIATELDAVAIAPSYAWHVPEALRGGFNAAASRFGARVVSSPNIDEEDLDDFAPLLDGLARYGRWTSVSLRTPREGRDAYQQPTIELAGEAPVPVQGFLINPTSTIQPSRMLGSFEVALSLDGQRFDTVLSAKLDALTQEQAFVLDTPVPARFARLIPLSGALGQAASLQSVKLGEFKVVAERSWRPPSMPINLAAADNGGHLVWAEPWIRKGTFDEGLLFDDESAPSPPMGQHDDARVVLGFEHRRAARLHAVDIDLMPEGELPESAQIAVAMESPLGPWTPVGEMPLNTTSSRYTLQSPVWARYVRLLFQVPEGARKIVYPDRIALVEAAGPSILGEWGHLTAQGPYEAENTPAPPPFQGEPDNRSKATAMALSPNKVAPGRALLDAYSSWYRITPTATENQLTLRLAGRPSLEGSPTLMDSAGETVPLLAVENNGVEATWQAWIEPGKDYWLEVVEPPRSVIFSWDTSGSVAAWLPTITSALLSYAETIQPGRDEVNLLPFGYQKPLLENWQGHAYPLMRMLLADPRETSSSNAEGTLAVAAQQMIDRPGKKAVLLLTDAATSTDAQLWPMLRQGRPQVFSMKITSEGALSSNPHHEIDLMQDWAQVRGGHFEYVTGLGDLARGFDRAVAWLKRPVDFEVEVSFQTVEDPSPATLQVTGSGQQTALEASGAVQIILDASGSMLQRMDGRRRIDIAKDAIRDIIRNDLPDGVPMALRVYGHKISGTCQTDLEVPLGPLDKDAFLSKINRLQAINLAKTPIADSLAAVAADLADAEGRRLVILLTDGEETCDGDPEAALAALAEQGVDVRVNIVGFAIDNEALKQEFQSWAELGGGQYLDAAEGDALGKALQQSLQVPFEVIDQAGEVVARGLVGEAPIEVQPGRYSVRIRGARDQLVRGIELAPGDERVIEASQ